MNYTTLFSLLNNTMKQIQKFIRSTNVIPYPLIFVLFVMPEAFAKPPISVADLFFDNSPGIVLLEYHQVQEMIAEPDAAPLLRIFGDGHVKIHFPVYMKRAGDYEMRLSDSELVTLLRELLQDGILDYDPATVAQQRKNIHQAKNSYYAESDVSRTELTLNIQGYVDNQLKQTVPLGKTTLRAKNIQSLSKKYPGIMQLQGIARAENRILNLLSDSRLQRK